MQYAMSHYLFCRKQKLTISIAENAKVVDISAYLKETQTLFSKSSKTKIVDIIVTDIGNNKILETPLTETYFIEQWFLGNCSSGLGVGLAQVLVFGKQILVFILGAMEWSLYLKC